jgi:enediyne biosynthesis protein E4
MNADKPGFELIPLSVFKSMNFMIRDILNALIVVILISGCGDSSKHDARKDGASLQQNPPNTTTSDLAPTPSKITWLSHADGITWSTLSDRRPTGNAPLMELIKPSESGVDVMYPIDVDHVMKRLYVSGFAAGGVAVGDVDGDELPDLFFVGTSGRNRLFRQTKPFKFEEITDIANINVGNPWGSAAAMIDIDSDGDLDIYVTVYDAANQLFINRGNGVFYEQAERFGLNIIDASLVPAFCDYDCDGDLDLYLLTNRFYRQGGFPTTPAFTRDENGIARLLPQYKKYLQLVTTGPGSVALNVIPRPDRLFRHDSSASGQIKFTDVSDRAGILEVGHGLSCTWWDFNEDGLPDIYVANDYDDPDHLYRNNGDGTFTDVIARVLPHTSWFSMGADVADVDGNGRLDLFVADMSGTDHFKSKTTMGAMNDKRIQSVAGPPPQVMRNALFLNNGTSRFWEAAQLTGVANSDWSWAAKFGDVDCDGWVDLIITNGMTRSFNNADIPFSKRLLQGRSEWDLFESTPTRPEKNLAFRNQGNLKFVSVGPQWGFDAKSISFAAAWADLDGDGDLDPIVVNMDKAVSVYRNNSATGNRIVVRLRGRHSNRMGIGATVTIETARGRQVRSLQPMTGFKSSNEPQLHFGLGKDETIKQLTVRWPSGHAQTFKQLAGNRRYLIIESQEKPPTPAPSPPAQQAWFKKIDLKKVRHHETHFDDFKMQALLPNKLSRLGPGIAWGDLDGDGDDDLFVGGASGHAGKLYRNQGNFKLEPVYNGSFLADTACEDMGAVFLDVDGDGDLDLFVVSGGVETEQLQDRLYLNDGTGKFKKAPRGTVPDESESGSVVIAGDFDQDGDLDLFVGTRVIPGQYPTPPSSHLLVNDGGRFIDKTDALAPGLKKTGLVTGALWSDVNNDGRLDLLVTHEWGPVKLFQNQGGKLIDRTMEAGLAKTTGWFNGITGGDIDHDGDIDYVVTNFGLNTKYHASQTHPAVLYYGDFEGKGKKQLVEAEYENDKLFPIRGKSCSTHAMPQLRGKFPTYKKFAMADVFSIYTKQCLNDSQRFTANTLETGLLINDGKGHFQFKPLPRIAQISPSFGVTVTEVDGDGHPDIYLVQNFFSPQLETGRMDEGLSLLLRGRGDGSFEAVSPARSGLIVSGDAKSLTTTDINNDGKPDFVVGVNNSPVVAMTNMGNQKLLAVRLIGAKGNLSAVGARVTLKAASGQNQTAEVYAGSGYLSQSSPVLYFGIQPGDVNQIEIRWPDGEMISYKVPKDTFPVTLRRKP